MTTRNVALYRLLGSLLLLIGFTLSAYAQEDLQIASLFKKYGKQKDVTYVELNGSILRSYRMTAYRSLVFKDVTPYKADIVQCLKQDVAGQQVTKTQEITESGQLLSAYYQLSKKNKLNRYILYKVGKQNSATLIYIEGTLSEEELMKMLYRS